VGIGRPESRDPQDVAEYVLTDIPPSDLELTLQKAFPTVLALLETHVNLKLQD